MVAEWKRVKNLDPAVGVGAVRSSPRHVGGCGPRLQQAAEANAEKLGKARPRQTHLAIRVGPPECSPDPRLCAVPDVGGIDRFWVLLRNGPRSRTSTVSMDGSVIPSQPRPSAWHAARSDIEWTPIVD